ncbi:MAG TPA: hypothetical protein G4O19_01735 [Dehalococcoidia bacterium]|nr:hypothetical protein [Dehalococcoidia bacterium]
MIERVHEHIINELQQNARTDIVFILTSILLNLVILATNSIMASTDEPTATTTIVMVLFVVLLIVVNSVVISGLLRGKQSRQLLINGLLKMYRDQGVDGYYDAALLGNYNLRYNLFTVAVVSIGVIAAAVPFILM